MLRLLINKLQQEINQFKEKEMKIKEIHSSLHYIPHTFYDTDCEARSGFVNWNVRGVNFWTNKMLHMLRLAEKPVLFVWVR